MKTKEEVIKDAYGEYWEQIKDNLWKDGWVEEFNVLPEIRKSLSDFCDYKNLRFSQVGNHMIRGYRPKSLQGIEDNNGWIKIESENDLPKEDCKCWVVTESYSTCLALFLSDTKRFWELADLDFRLLPTHYKILEEPKPPLY
jgi:hypothetical protein